MNDIEPFSSILFMRACIDVEPPAVRTTWMKELVLAKEWQLQLHSRHDVPHAESFIDRLQMLKT